LRTVERYVGKNGERRSQTAQERRLCNAGKNGGAVAQIRLGAVLGGKNG